MRSCAENHGGPRRLFRFRWQLRLSALSRGLLVLLAALLLLALLLRQPLAAALVAGLGAILVARIAIDLGRLRADLARGCRQVCEAAGLLPLPARGRGEGRAPAWSAPASQPQPES